MAFNVPDGWTVRQLQEIADVHLSSVNKKEKEGEPAVRLCNYMDVYTHPTISDAIGFMWATARPVHIEKLALRRGDVMITKDSEDPSDIGVPSVVVTDFDDPVVCGYHLALLRPNGAVHGEYLAWALRSRDLRNQFERTAHGTTRFGLTSSAIKHAEALVPPVWEQKKIAAILSSVDDAIAATRSVIDQTKRVKKGLLQTLMIRGIGHTRFKKTEIGEIPEGWEVVRVEECCDILDKHRVPLNSEERRERQGDIPYWGANGVVDHIDDYLFDEPLVLIAEDGGYFDQASDRPIAHLVDGKVWVNNHAHVLRVKEHVSREWFYYWFVHRDITRWINSGTRSKLNQGDLRQLPLAAPPADEQEAIVTTLRAVDDMIEAGEEWSDQLSTLKAGLMQDLLTGRVRVQPD